MSGLKKIKTLLLRMIIVFFLILGGLVLYYAGRLAYKELFKKRLRIEYFQSRLNAETRRINSVIEAVQLIPKELADILEIQDTKDENAKILLQSVLFNSTELYAVDISYEPYQYYKDSLYHNIYLYRSGDSTVYDNKSDSTYNYFYMDWYLVPKTLMKPSWTEPYFESTGDHVFMSTFSVPFFRYFGTKQKMIGIVSVDVSIETLTNRIENIGKKMKGEAYLLSDKGTILTAPTANWINNETIFTLSEEKNLPVLREIGRDLQKGISGVKIIEKFQNQQDVYAFYSIIPTNKWGFIFLITKEELGKY